MAKNTNSVNLLKAPTQRTLSDQIADQLRQAILTEQLEPNQRLVEQDIAETMQTSRGPVRDALSLLVNEGLVVHKSHRGTFVARFSLEDVDEIYTLREALESLAIKFAIKNATPEEIDELDKLVKSMDTLICQQDYSQFEATDIDLEFHHTLCRISGHKRLLATWEALSPQIRLLLLKHKLWDPREFAEDAVEWHLRIVEAIRQRDIDAALEEIGRHMALSAESLIEAMRKDNNQKSDG